MSEWKTPEGRSKGRLPGRKQCPRSRALWSSPSAAECREERLVCLASAGHPRCGDRSTDGTVGSAGQFWQGRLFRGSGWQRMLRHPATLQEMDQKTLQHLWFPS